MYNSFKYHILDIVHGVARLKLVKLLLKPLKRYISHKYAIKKNALFIANGERVFKELDKLLVENDIRYSVTYGTLLGAVREHGPIPHDMDYDICIWADDYSPKIQTLLSNNGFLLRRRFLVDDGKSGREETYEKDGVSIDFFYIFGDENYPTYSCCFKRLDSCGTITESVRKFGYVVVRRLQIPVSKSVVRMHFGSIEVNAMENYTEFLRVCYGENYLTPDPTYKPKDGDCIRFVWAEKKGIMEHLSNINTSAKKMSSR